MSKLRVFQNVKYKRTAAGFSMKNLGTVLLLVMLLPYMITLLFGNLWQGEEAISLQVGKQLSEGRFFVINRTPYGDERIPLEIYVADKLSRTMESNYEKEALKAQAILIRTNLMAGMAEEMVTEDKEYARAAVAESCREAAAETKGMYITWEGTPIHAAYHQVSNGATRSAKEVLKDESCPYLTSVLCSRDFLSPAYTSERVFGIEEFDRLWEEVPEVSTQEREEIGQLQTKRKASEEFEIIRDSVGYVRYMKYQEKWVTGEELRYRLGILSAGFQVEKKEKEVYFYIKGAGHGLGMSQFGANEMAKEGKTCPEIIEYFFQDVAITKY